ncbi:MAG: Flp pilus assembly complex ATPase component TadA, partial [Myxococcales bacterium]|nr:Flp pilus assembly complex ATPase component TadA [Myxococcales bacterium]
RPGQAIDDMTWKRVEQTALGAIDAGALPDGYDAATAATLVTAEALAIGPLTALLDDESVGRITVDGTAVRVLRDGRVEDAGAFSHPVFAVTAGLRLLAGAGQILDGHTPFGEAWLADGTRAHVAQPAVGGPYLTLDRPGQGAQSLDEMVAGDVLSANMAAFLRHAIELGRNVIVSCNEVDARFEFIGALLDAGAPHLRVVAVEGGGRLSRGAGARVVLSGAPGADNVTLVQQAIKMRPDRLVVADARGPEAYHALSALGGAVNGGIIGVDAESPDDAIIRLMRHASLAQSIDAAQVDAAIRDTADVLVQLLHYADGRRRVTQIMDIDGEIQEVFNGLEAFRAQSGFVPRWVLNAQSLGFSIDANLFQ